MKQLREKGGFKQQNVIAGFRSSGIWPLDINQALKKLPPTTAQHRPINAPEEENLVAQPERPVLETDEQSVRPIETVEQPVRLVETDEQPIGPAETDELTIGAAFGVGEQANQEENEIQDQNILPVFPQTDSSPHIQLTQRDSLVVPANSPAASDNTPTALTPAGNKPKHDIDSFRKILLEALAPLQRQEHTKKKRLSFNNMALTEKEVMKQLEDLEKLEEEKRERKLRRQEERAKKSADKKRKTCPKEKNTSPNTKKKDRPNVQPKVSHANKKRRVYYSDSSDLEDVPFESDSSDDNDWGDVSSENSFDFMPGASSSKDHIKPHQNQLIIKVNDYVAAVYEKEWFVAFVLEAPTTDSDDSDDDLGVTAPVYYYKLRFMEKKGKNKFIWPQKHDEMLVITDDILCTVAPPVPVSSRHVGLVQPDVKNVEKLFMQYVSS